MTLKQELHKLVGRIFGKIERSQHVFLAGLAVAFAIEIVVDWNSTFYEVNVLRSQLRQKAVHYVSMMRLAAEDPLAAEDVPRLRELGRRVLEDDEVGFVRITDQKGGTVVESGAPLGERYPKQLRRDISGMLVDPSGLRERIAGSRHRDVFQTVTDAEDRMVRFFTTPISDPVNGGMEAGVAYQDRLYDEKTRAEDRAVTWALAIIDQAADDPGTPVADGERPVAKPGGLVVIALKTDHLRRAIRKKLYKGVAITVFFLCIILFQQMSARRSKLKLISLTDALSVARQAIAASLLEKPPDVPGLEAAFAFEQAERIGGTVYDLAIAATPSGVAATMIDVFLACPEGSGVDVAFASVFIRDASVFG